MTLWRQYEAFWKCRLLVGTIVDQRKIRQETSKHEGFWVFPVPSASRPLCFYGVCVCRLSVIFDWCGRVWALCLWAGCFLTMVAGCVWAGCVSAGCVWAGYAWTGRVVLFCVCTGCVWTGCARTLCFSGSVGSVCVCVGSLCVCWVCVAGFWFRAGLWFGWVDVLGLVGCVTSVCFLFYVFFFSFICSVFIIFFLIVSFVAVLRLFLNLFCGFRLFSSFSAHFPFN